MAELSTEILHKTDNMFLIKIWENDCQLVVNSVFEGTNEECLKQCKKLITIHNAQRATYEIYTPTKPKTN